ncbi:MAG: PTH1 family peptidyl-tRNA hydrolase [Verrucomicrobiales bacterium]
MSALRAIFGLGNPGRDYEETRHNAGFLVLDRLAERLPPSNGAPFGPAEFRHIRRLESDLLKTSEGYLIKPTTFMNDSGEAVSQVCRFYRIPSDQILIVYDDIDIELGRLRFREQGSAGGHNGIKSIIQHLGTETFPRLKVGIGRKENRDHGRVVSHVLGKFDGDELPLVKESLDRAVEAVIDAMTHGIDHAMTAFN